MGMQNEAFLKELAERNAEAERDPAAAVEKLVSKNREDLDRSVVDSSREIAEVDELLGLGPEGAAENGASSNGHPGNGSN